MMKDIDVVKFDIYKDSHNQGPFSVSTIESVIIVYCTLLKRTKEHKDETINADIKCRINNYLNESNVTSAKADFIYNGCYQLTQRTIEDINWYLMDFCTGPTKCIYVDDFINTSDNEIDYCVTHKYVLNKYKSSFVKIGSTKFNKFKNWTLW